MIQQHLAFSAIFGTYEAASEPRLRRVFVGVGTKYCPGDSQLLCLNLKVTD